MKLIYTYKKQSNDISFEEFWTETSGDFDKDDGTHVMYLMQEVSRELNLDDYSIKRLETTIKTELPFVASKRHLAKKWLKNNFNL